MDPDPSPEALRTQPSGPSSCYAAIDFMLATNFNCEHERDHSKMKNESMKKSLEKSKNVIEEKRKNA